MDKKPVKYTRNEPYGNVGEKGNLNNGTLPTPPPTTGMPECLKGFDLSTPEKSRETLALIIKARAEKAIDKDTAQALTWMMSVYLPSYRAEKWTDLEKKVEALERRLKL